MELAHILSDGANVAQANNLKAEQLGTEEKPKVVSGLSSRVEEKNVNRHDGQEERTSRKELGRGV